MVFSREFKQALSALPSAEKDKLLFRLLKKDLELANRLEFELLSEESTEQKRDALQKILQREIEKATDLFYFCILIFILLFQSHSNYFIVS